MMEERSLACINNGQGTRIDVKKGNTSCLALMLVSDSLVTACDWYVKNDSTIGSDHYPVNTNVWLFKKEVQLDGEIDGVLRKQTGKNVRLVVKCQ